MQAQTEFGKGLKIILSPYHYVEDSLKKTFPPPWQERQGNIVSNMQIPPLSAPAAMLAISCNY